MISNELLKEKIILKATSGNLIENNEFFKRQRYKEIECERFKLPQNWIWTTLKEIIDYKNGYAFNSTMMSKNKNGTPVIKSANIGKKKVIIDSKTDYIENPTEKMWNCIINKNDILMVLSSQSSNVQPLGISAIYKFETPALLNQRVLKLSARENINPDYLLYVINSIWFHDKLSNKAAGLAQANLKLDHVLNMEVPLPPLEEQEKIVKKIEKLFEFIDKKEKNDKEKDKLKTLLKEKILDSAIRGELVENDLSLPIVDVEEIKEVIPFEIPNNWKWCCYKKIGVSGIGLTYKPNNINDKGMIVLRSSNIQDGKLDLKDIIRVSCEVKDNIIVNENDILICARNGSKRLIGKSCLLENLSEKMTYGAFMTIFRTPYYKYVYWFMQSKHYYKQLHENTNTMTINQITQKKLGSLLIPIPPLEQQEKIVEKIEKCFELIEQL